MIYKTLHIKLKIEHHCKPGMESCALEVLAVPALYVAPVVLIPVISHK